MKRLNIRVTFFISKKDSVGCLCERRRVNRIGRTRSGVQAVRKLHIDLQVNNKTGKCTEDNVHEGGRPKGIQQ